MKRIYLQLPDFQATGHYRSVLPARFCKEPLASEGIDLDLRMDFNPSEDIDRYDAFCFHRFLSPGFLPTLLKIKDAGKIIVWETDDLLTEVPEWSPARTTAEQRHYFIEDAANLITSWCPLLPWMTQSQPSMERSGLMVQRHCYARTSSTRANGPRFHRQSQTIPFGSCGPGARRTARTWHC